MVLEKVRVHGRYECERSSIPRSINGFDLAKGRTSADNAETETAEKGKVTELKFEVRYHRWDIYYSRSRESDCYVKKVFVTCITSSFYLQKPSVSGINLQFATCNFTGIWGQLVNW